MKRCWLIIILLLSFSAVTVADNTESLEKALRTSIQQDPPEKTLILLKSYPDKKSFFYYFVSGQTLMALSDPGLAQTYYQAAYATAKNNDEKIVALFGLENSALWLENYEDALKAYHSLSQLPLNSEDIEIATAGAVIAKTNMDYPRSAYAMLPRPPLFAYPKSVIAATRAALAAGWGYKAKAIWQANNAVLEKIPAGSYLKNQEVDVNWHLLQETAPGSANLDYYTIRDSANFKIERKSVYGSYRALGVNSNTAVLAMDSSYFSPTHVANANMLFLKQDFLNIWDKLNLNLAAVPTRVNYYIDHEAAWDPFLWQTGATYYVNDKLYFNVSNDRGLVETPLALQNRIMINTTEGSIFVHPWARWYARFGGFHARFTDTNNRDGFSTAAMYQLIRELGLFTELRYRQYRNTFFNDPNYFSPAKLEETTLFLIFKRRLTPTIFLFAEGGVGNQFIHSTPDSEASKQSILAYDLAIAKNIGRNSQLKVNYGYTQNAFNNFVGAYAQTYFDVNFQMFFD
ncbi:MAG: hypothetical protein Q8R79_02760 [Legionellaceae bacterium]|nr:hypothetical protein [Legionellaceae bacterium]